MWQSKVASSAVIVLCFITDELGLTLQTSLTDVILGYIALALSLLVFQPPLPTVTIAAGGARPSSKPRFGDESPKFRSRSSSISHYASASPLTCSVGDVNATLASGIILALLTIFASTITSASPHISVGSLFLITLTIASMACAIVFSQPSSLRSHSKSGLAIGGLTTASCSFLFSPTLWPGTIINGGMLGIHSAWDPFRLGSIPLVDLRHSLTRFCRPFGAFISRRTVRYKWELDTSRSRRSLTLT